MAIEQATTITAGHSTAQSDKAIKPNESDMLSTPDQRIVLIEIDAPPACGLSSAAAAFEDQLPATHSERSRRSVKILLDPTEVSGLIRNSSPVPAALYSRTASRLIARLWGLRCPTAATCDIDVSKALQGIITHLTSDQCVMLCIGYWQFDTNPEMVHIWEFYEFIFHRERYTNQRQIFRHIEAKHIRGLSIEETICQWDTMLTTINRHVNDTLSEIQYPLCVCDIKQPHSFHALSESIQVLEGRGELPVLEIAKYAFIAYESLRVLDSIDKGITRRSQHPMSDRCHRTVLKSLRVKGVEQSADFQHAMEYETAYEVGEGLLQNGLPSKFSM